RTCSSLVPSRRPSDSQASDLASSPAVPNKCVSFAASVRLITLTASHSHASRKLLPIANTLPDTPRKSAPAVVASKMNSHLSEFRIGPAKRTSSSPALANSGNPSSMPCALAAFSSVTATAIPAAKAASASPSEPTNRPIACCANSAPGSNPSAGASPPRCRNEKSHAEPKHQRNQNLSRALHRRQGTLRSLHWHSLLRSHARTLHPSWWLRPQTHLQRRSRCRSAPHRRRCRHRPRRSL